MLYLALPVDLRDRYPSCSWLVYGKMVAETEYAPGDILVIAEWVIPDRVELLRTLYKAHQQGARVIYVGPVESETEDFKRQLCVMGIFDYLFFTDEIILGRIDHLIEHPRTPSDIPLFQDETKRVLGDMPPVVDVFKDDEGECPLSEPGLMEETDGKPWLRQLWHRKESRKGGIAEGRSENEGAPLPPQTRKIVWPNLEPIHVRICGDPGVGKTFLAWQIASLCQARELPTAVLEDDVNPLVTWVNESWRSHIYHRWPKKGYRVVLDTRKGGDLADADLVIAVCWPERSSFERVLLQMESAMVSQSRIVWIVNHRSAGIAFPVNTGGVVLSVPYDPRQFAAIRMQKSLVRVDPEFAALFAPIIERIADQFSHRVRTKEEGGEETHVAALGL